MRRRGSYKNNERYAAGDIISLRGKQWVALKGVSGVIPGTDFTAWQVHSDRNSGTSFREGDDGGLEGFPTWGANPCDWLNSRRSRTTPEDQEVPEGIDPRMHPYITPDGLFPNRPNRFPTGPPVPTDFENWPTSCPGNAKPGLGGWPYPADGSHPPLGHRYGQSTWPSQGPYENEAGKEILYWRKQLEEMLERFDPFLTPEQRGAIVDNFLGGRYPLLYYIMFDPRLRGLWIEIMQIMRGGFMEIAEKGEYIYELLWQIVLHLLYHPYYGPIVRRLWEFMPMTHPIWDTPSPAPVDEEGNPREPWPPVVSPRLIDYELCKKYLEQNPPDIQPEDPIGLELPPGGIDRYLKHFKLPTPYVTCPELYNMSITPSSPSAFDSP